MKPYGMCPKCLKMKSLTKHHIYPKAFFQQRKNPGILMICEECHQEFNKLVPLVKLEKSFYERILAAFLRSDNVKTCF